MTGTRDFAELPARARVEALLDPGTARVLCGPFDRQESRWLVRQGIVPQADDGVVVARGALDGQAVVVAAVEQGFLGGALGEVSGAKIHQALHLAAGDCRAGRPTAAVLLLESGGVRLQEATLGLAAVADICSALLDLRALAPVVGVVAGDVGAFGGAGIIAGLCGHLVVTPQARVGLNGPAVIEQEAGVTEFDAADRALVWQVMGGTGRHAAGLADTLVPAGALRDAVRAALRADHTDPRSRRITRTEAPAVGEERPAVDSRGRTWLTALASRTHAVVPSVLRGDADGVAYLAVVPDPGNPFPRARRGEVGLAECSALAATVRQVMADDAGAARKRAIIAVVDTPGQAYGLAEETAGLHQAIASVIDAYHGARVAGHPVIALVVGAAMSGGFLAHGLQATKILALDDPGVHVHAMGTDAAARITARTTGQLDELARTVPPLSHRIRDWAELGFTDALLTAENPDRPTPADLGAVREALADAVRRARLDPARLPSPPSKRVRELMERQWN